MGCDFQFGRLSPLSSGMATVRIGTYIGSGAVNGAKVTYQLHFLDKKFGWMDYKMKPPVSSAPEESWHAEGKYTVEGGTLSFEIGGLPGQGRAGQIHNFTIIAGEEGAVVLEKDGVKCQPRLTRLNRPVERAINVKSAAMTSSGRSSRRRAGSFARRVSCVTRVALRSRVPSRRCLMASAFATTAFRKSI